MSKKQMPTGRKLTREELFGAFIEAYMTLRQLSLEEVAKHCFVSVEYVKALIAGDYPATIIEDELIGDLAEVLNTDPEVLILALRSPGGQVVRTPIPDDYDPCLEAERILDTVTQTASDDESSEKKGKKQRKGKQNPKQLPLGEEFDYNP